MSPDRSAVPIACWDDLPDPRDPEAPRGRTCQLGITAGAWLHIIADHVATGREPWGEWLTPRLVAVLSALVAAKAPGEQPGPGLKLLDEASTGIEPAVRASLARPLALLYDEVAGGGDEASTGREVWLLVMPVGALLVVHARRYRAHAVATCFYPSVACAAPRPERRWVETVKRLVQRHAVLRDGKLVAPGTGEVVSALWSGGAVRRLRRRIRFVTPESWGFVTALKDAPWLGRLSSWEAADVMGVRKRHRLKPTRTNQRGGRS